MFTTPSPPPCVEECRVADSYRDKEKTIPAEIRSSYTYGNEKRAITQHYAPYLVRQGRTQCKWGAHRFLPRAGTIAVTMPAVAATHVSDIQQRFYRLADEWTQAIGSSSSLTAMSRHPKYREIVQLGWPVVPYLLQDLQRNRGFWFPALDEITGIRPFDLSDAGNSRRMIQAWVQWEKRKKLI